MHLTEAIDLLSPAVDPSCRVWADLGAGAGTFTAALAHILGTGATIHAVDREERAVNELRRLRLPPSSASVVPAKGDIGALSEIRELAGGRLEAAVLANVLHYFEEPEKLLKDVSSRLPPEGRIVLVEYDRTSGNRWVPHPLPAARMPRIAGGAGLEWHGPVAERPSRYQGTLYVGFLTARRAWDRPSGP